MKIKISKKQFKKELEKVYEQTMTPDEFIKKYQQEKTQVNMEKLNKELGKIFVPNIFQVRKEGVSFTLLDDDIVIEEEQICKKLKKLEKKEKNPYKKLALWVEKKYDEYLTDKNKNNSDYYDEEEDYDEEDDYVSEYNDYGEWKESDEYEEDYEEEEDYEDEYNKE